MKRLFNALCGLRTSVFKRPDNETRLAITKLNERILILEESSNLHHFAITHCTGGCKPELRRKTALDS